MCPVRSVTYLSGRSPAGFAGLSSGERFASNIENVGLSQRGHSGDGHGDHSTAWVYWQAQVRRQGHPPLTRTFHLKADAELWARQREAELDRGGLPADSRLLRSHTLADLLKRYEHEVVPRKRGADRERYMLRVILRHPTARASLHRLTAAEIAKYRDHRLSLVKADTVRRELALAAAKARGVKLGNPNGARALKGKHKQVGNKQAVAAVKANAERRAANLKSIIDDLRALGATSIRAIAAELNAKGILTPRGGAWHPTSVARLLSRISA